MATSLTKEGWTPLHFASTKGWAGTAKVLVDHGADINAKEGSGWTPFALALRKGHADVVKVLLDKDAEVASLVPDGWTLLDVAPHTGQADIVKERLDMGPMCHENGRTLLFDAARCGQAQSVQILLDSGRFAVNDTDWFGTSPLFAATRNGHVETVEVLLKTPDIRTDSKDGFGRTLLWWARRGGHDRVAELLLDHDQTAGSQTDHQEDLPESNPIEFKDSSRYCDACTLSMPDGCEQYQCPTCSNGNFHICLPCFEFGVRCRDTSHVLKHSPATESNK
ncbi:hypothetical protein NM208_g1910 [Fusarium decemcellulare]|uniref:Uncharacterized protein n=1 Tax=Fusarium decemcellulare TaxID=57161 RepID=A0ACC1SU93_9HYPO|nr:hypothetical protein NM208_g1910 [Fusarium decemcellulare]